MKIGILTFHKAYNYGAFMQCYTLSSELKKLFPTDVIEVVDFCSYNLINDYEKSTLKKILGDKRTNGKTPLLMITKRLLKTIFNFKRLRKTKIANKQIQMNFQSSWDFLPLSKEKLVSDDPLEFYNAIQGKYDVLIVGSDAVWNDNQTSWPNLYLLHDITDCYKFSYAASTYGMDYLSRSKQYSDYVKESLQQFHFVGVRDAVTADYVKYCSNGFVQPVHTCDPSFLLDLSELEVDIKELKSKLHAQGVSFVKPIIGLMCSDWLAKAARENLGDEYEYVSVYTHNGYEDVFLDNLSPFEWARVFSLFDATITHFFHGTLFSIKNGTLTFAIEKSSYYKNNYTTKIEDVLVRLKIEEQCYYEFDQMNEESWVKIDNKIKNNNREQTKVKYGNCISREKESFLNFINVLSEVHK